MACSGPVAALLVLSRGGGGDGYSWVAAAVARAEGRTDDDLRCRVAPQPAQTSAHSAVAAARRTFTDPPDDAPRTRPAFGSTGASRSQRCRRPGLRRCAYPSAARPRT